MDVDEIRSVQSRERQTDSLQELRDSFYEEAGEFVRALRAERERAAERAADPFDAPEVNRLSDDIATAEQTLEAIYERRVGKIVKMASLAAADMPTEESGLTIEERDLFETLVAAIEDNRERVFDVLDGASAGADAVGGASAAVDSRESDDVDREPPTDAFPTERSPDEQRTGTTTAPSGGEVPAADLMDDGDDSSEVSADPRDDSESSTSESTTESAVGDDSAAPADSLPPEASGDPTRRDGGSTTVASAGGSTADGTGADDAVERATVRITDDVGEILGVDDRAYDLTTDDVVTLPETNAGPLIERGAAERLE